MMQERSPVAILRQETRDSIRSVTGNQILYDWLVDTIYELSQKLNSEVMNMTSHVMDTRTLNFLSAVNSISCRGHIGSLHLQTTNLYLVTFLLITDA